MDEIMYFVIIITHFHNSIEYCFAIEVKKKKFFLSGTHLILDKQLDDIVKWTEQFRKETLKENENVKFDFICGDFNFDNLSPGGVLFWTFCFLLMTATLTITSSFA